LRVQRLRAGEGPPQLHAGGDQPLAEAVEEIIGGGAAQAFVHRPDIELDDAPLERVVLGPAPARRLGDRSLGNRGLGNRRWIRRHERTSGCRGSP
jgi:hypothetical protein